MRAILSLSLLGVLAACGEAPPPAAVVPVVKTFVVGATAGGDGHAYSGEVRARHEAAVAFRVGGKVVARLVDVGALVVPGQELARLDAADFSLQLRQAEAQRALAAAEAARYRDLRAKNFVSQSALDARETALAAAEAQAELAKNQAAYAVLRADKAGAVAQVLAEPGQVVAPGQPIFRLAQAGEIEVAVSVPEARWAALRPGMPAEVTLWDSKSPLRGRLRELSPVADAATRTYPARVTLLEAGPEVGLGMTARVHFAQAAAGAPIVPAAAIFQQGKDPAVWIVGADDTVALRPVGVGAYTDAGAVIVSGLEAGQRIVAAGVHKLAAGQKVRVAP